MKIIQVIQIKKHKGKLQKEARESYQNHSEEEKEKNVSIIMIEIRILLKKIKKRKWRI